MSTDFLIHRDSEGRIVRTVPYENIMDMLIFDTHETPEWGVYFTLQNGSPVTFYGSQAEAERYLAEWRAWWELESRRNEYTVQFVSDIANIEIKKSLSRWCLNCQRGKR